MQPWARDIVDRNRAHLATQTFRFFERDERAGLRSSHFAIQDLIDNEGERSLFFDDDDDDHGVDS